MTHDAIVVGAGHNGLAAAVHLSSRGWKVLVLEREAQPGGAVRTAACTLPGFRHDLYAMNLSLFAGSPCHAEHGALLARHGLAFVGVDRPFASVFPQGAPVSWLGVEQGLDATLGHIARASVSDARRWQALSARFDREAPYLFGLLGAPMPSARPAAAGATPPAGPINRQADIPRAMPKPDDRPTEVSPR